MSRGLFCPSCLRPVEADQPGCRACRHVRPASGWPADEYLGRVINGKYRVTRKLGEGGFGIVLHARQLQGGNDLGDVVLKFLHPHLAGQPPLRKRFVNEAKASRALRSPHVVKVFDFDFDERGLPFIVMEYLQGSPLAAALERGPLPPLRAVRIGIQVASALHECHLGGIVHRDLKPSNILLLSGKEDFVKLIDFGVARLPDTSLTQTMLGTPKYMAPEQIRQKDLDDGVDIFALGVVLFETLTGEEPIAARSALEYLQRNVSERPLLLRELAPHLPQRLEELLDSMMAKDRAARPATVERVEDELRAIAAELEKLPDAPALAPAQTRTHSAASTGSLSAEGRRGAAMATPGSLAPVVTDSRPPMRRSWRVKLSMAAAVAGVLGGAAVLGVVLGRSDPATTAASSPDARAAAPRLDAALDASILEVGVRSAEAGPPPLSKKHVRRHHRPTTKKKAPAGKTRKTPEDEFPRLPGGL
jgi:eukaryotic-like serine/threonine-protein kinase